MQRHTSYTEAFFDLRSFSIVGSEGVIAQR